MNDFIEWTILLNELMNKMGMKEQNEKKQCDYPFKGLKETGLRCEVKGFDILCWALYPVWVLGWKQSKENLNTLFIFSILRREIEICFFKLGFDLWGNLSLIYSQICIWFGFHDQRI